MKAINDITTKALRRGLWSILHLQRMTGLAPARQYALEYIAYLRLVQHLRETGARQNPDHAVGHLFTPVERMLARLEDVEHLRAQAIYHYVLTRTRHYDRVFEAALDEGFEQFVFFGAGADTRSFRFREMLDERRVRVIETDLDPWLSERMRRCRQFPHPHDFRQIEFILGRTDLESWIAAAGYDPVRKTLFMAEGVTPYLDAAAHDALLRFVTQYSPAGSRLAYDGKYKGAGDVAGLFRMPREANDIAAILAAAGLEAAAITPSAEAQKDLASYEAPVFDEDVFIIAEVQ